MGRHSDAVREIKLALNKYNQLLIKYDKLLPDELRQQSTLCIDVYEKLKCKQSDIISMSEKVLYISSKIGSYLFFPWMTFTTIEDDSNNMFKDPDGQLQLSPGQLLRFDKWERAGKALNAQPTMETNTDLDIHQDVLHDCSLVSSFLSILCLNRRTNRMLLVDNLYPKSIKGVPRISQTGRYTVLLNINGTSRQVTIDDLLPCSNDGSSLIVYSGDGVLWPALIEKAYVKVMGGYNFAGSHAAYDSFVLTKWIPEYISLKFYLGSPGKAQHQLWKKLASGWENGDLMICVGTGNLLPEESRVFGLASDHDYAILDLKADQDTKQVKIRNPWQQESDKKDCVDWIDFSSLFRRFDHLYLNWNPDLYEHRNVVHFVWSIDSVIFGQESNSLLKCPQYSLSNTTNQDAMVSLLLERHLNGPQSLKTRSEFLRLTVYDSGTHIVLSEEAVRHDSSPAINTLYITLNISIPAKTTVLVVITSENISSKTPSLRLTLSVFSSEKLILEKAKAGWNCRAHIQGAWTTDSSPGNWTNEDFYKNPQFKLSLDRQAELVKIYLFSPLSVPVHIFAFWGSGKCIKAFSEKDIVSSSGKYRQNHCICNIKKLLPGNYTIVVSTFEPLVGSFSLHAFSDTSLSLEPIFLETSVCTDADHVIFTHTKKKKGNLLY